MNTYIYVYISNGWFAWRHSEKAKGTLASAPHDSCEAGGEVGPHVHRPQRIPEQVCVCVLLVVCVCVYVCVYSYVCVYIYMLYVLGRLVCILLHNAARSFETTGSAGGVLPSPAAGAGGGWGGEAPSTRQSFLKRHTYMYVCVYMLRTRT
jgi:hypothetical protein